MWYEDAVNDTSGVRVVNRELTVGGSVGVSRVSGLVNVKGAVGVTGVTGVVRTAEVLPARAGEQVRSALLRRRGKRSAPEQQRLHLE